MINFIKKIFKDKTDESVHSQFVRFSKGLFENRAVLKVKRGKVTKLNSTFELANELVLFVISLTNKMHCSGVILSKEELPLNGKKKGSLISYEINQEIESSKLKNLIEKSYASLLDCEAEGISLKIKKKLPKPNPKGKKGKIKDNFCVLTLEDKYFNNVKEEFLFDLPEGKRYEINNSFNIIDILIPRGEKNPEEMRLNAKRKGIIKREAIVDKKVIISEKAFLV